MSEEEQKNSGGWISTILEGGLPQIIAGPAGKALSRLIGATIEIPASYVDGVAQGVKDKTAARSIISKAIAEKSAQIAVENPEIMERAVESLLASQYRKQKNKDEIAKLVIEDLNETPPPSDSDGPSEDWMNKFERYAEDASSDELRTMYAKLLAGEIRKERSVSAATLHFVSLLDGDVAELIEQTLPYVANDGLFFSELLNPKMGHVEMTVLEQSGFWTMNSSYTINYPKDGKWIFIAKDDLGCYSEAPPGHEVVFRTCIVSKAGRDLARVINREFDIDAFGKLILTKGSIKVIAGKVVNNGNRYGISNPYEIQRDPS